MPPHAMPIGHFYCRHDNRVVGSCPRQEAIGQCPLRLDCPAFSAACRAQHAAPAAR